VRRMLMLATSALVASLFLAPAAGAQEMMDEKMDDSMMMEEKMQEPMMEKGKMMEQPKMEEPVMEKGKMMEMPKTGGMIAPSTLILPVAAVLLLGSGLLAYGIQRRRS
jgi:hypothetical protein